MDERRPTGIAGEAVAVSLTTAANLAVNHLPPRASFPAHVGTTALLTWVSREAGSTWADMGWDPGRLGSGIRWGLAACVPIAAAVALGVSLPATRRFFADERAAAAGPRELAYEVLVRIPLATALLEEVLFRGALLGLFERRHPRWLADAMSGVLFGLWHILPTMTRLDEGRSHAGLAAVPRARGAIVGGVILATMAAGYGFAWLRDRSGSLVAPVIAHAALNGLAFLGAYGAARMREARVG